MSNYGCNLFLNSIQFIAILLAVFFYAGRVLQSHQQLNCHAMSQPDVEPELFPNVESLVKVSEYTARIRQVRASTSRSRRANQVEETSEADVCEQGNNTEDELDAEDDQEEQEEQEESVKYEDRRLQRVHSCRVANIRKMSDEITTKKTRANVTGKKRGHRSAFGDFIWRDELERVYLDKDGNLPLLRPAPAALSDEGIDRLHLTVCNTLCASGIRTFEISNEAEKVVVVDEVMQAVVRECDAVDNVELRREVYFKSEVLNSFGRVDRLVTKRGHKIMVIECKKDNFDKDTVQVVIGTEVMLIENLERDPAFQEPVYGIVSNFLAWHFMELTVRGARFHKVHINEEDVNGGLRRVTGSLLSILSDLPTEAAEPYI